MGKTIIEIKDEKGKLTEANDAIFELADAEKRDMTDDEKATSADNLLKLDRLEMELRTAEFRENKPGKVIPQMKRKEKQWYLNKKQQKNAQIYHS